MKGAQLADRVWVCVWGGGREGAGGGGGLAAAAAAAARPAGQCEAHMWEGGFEAAPAVAAAPGSGLATTVLHASLQQNSYRGPQSGLGTGSVPFSL